MQLTNQKGIVYTMCVYMCIQVSEGELVVFISLSCSHSSHWSCYNFTDNVSVVVMPGHVCLPVDIVFTNSKMHF